MATSKYFKPTLVLLIFLSLSFSPKNEIASAYKLVLFEGSDWCVNCIRFKENVLSNATFIQFIEKENIEIEKIDFPQRKKLDSKTEAYNAGMAEKYGFQGIFPTILLVKTSTDEVMTLKYHDQGALEFMKQIKTLIITE